MTLTHCTECKVYISYRDTHCPTCFRPVAEALSRHPILSPPNPCFSCGGPMKGSTESNNRWMGILITALGLIFAPMLIGLPFVIHGIFLWSKSDPIWRCEKCASKFPRRLEWYEYR